MVTQWYDPEGSSAALPGVIARALQRRGHDVHVLTGFPNYPTGELLPGYRVRAYQREVMAGVTVHRAPLYASHDSRAWRRAANYLSFAAGAAAVGITRLPSLDAVLVHGTPATAAIPALALRRLRQVPFVYHVQDLWPQTVVNSGFVEGGAPHIENALHRYCDHVYRRASAVAVTAPGMSRHIIDRGVPEQKVVFVPNWADEVAFRPAPKNAMLAARFGITSRFTVMYAGIFGAYQRLDVLLEAAALLRHRPDIGFALVGGGVQEQALRRQAAQESLDSVSFVPSQPFTEMAQVLALGDVQFISLANLPLFEATLPSKIQATMAAGRPILGAVAGDPAAVVRDSGAGRVVSQGSPESLAQAIMELADSPPHVLVDMGARARRHYLEQFSEGVVLERLLGVLHSAAGRHGVAA